MIISVLFTDGDVDHFHEVQETQLDQGLLSMLMPAMGGGAARVVRIPIERVKVIEQLMPHANYPIGELQFEALDMGLKLETLQ